MAGLFAAMKRRLRATVIFLLFLCVLLSACSDLTPYATEEFPHGVASCFTVYVCGAVENEGYFTVRAGTSYVALAELAGLVEQSVLSEWYTDAVDGGTEELVVRYYDGSEIRDCINANSPLIATRSEVDGLPADVVDLLADWIEAHGKLRNKQQLEEALGGYAQDYYYRLFIAREDYEKAD